MKFNFFEYDDRISCKLSNSKGWSGFRGSINEE
jgi:hypothetical protein